MTSQPKKGGLLRTLGSLRLAVAILVAMAVILAGATFYEAKYGTPAAQRNIYYSWWFGLVLVLLAVNVAAATITRWPWKPRHVGFVITHAAILIILGGCLTTQQLGVNARLALSEGSQDNRIVFDDDALQVTMQVDGKPVAAQVMLGTPPRVGRTHAFELGNRSYQARVLRYLPDAELRQQIVAGLPDDPPAVHVDIRMPGQGMMGGHEHGVHRWLLADDQMGQWSVQTPGFSIRASRSYAPPAEKAAPAEGGKGTLVATIDGREYEVPVEQALAGPVPIEDGRTTLHVQHYFERATVGAGGLTNDPSRPINPAVVVDVTTDGQTEQRKVFARFGDISSMHGGGPGRVQLALRHSQQPDGPVQVVLAPAGGDTWKLYEQAGEKLLTEAVLAPGTPVPIQTVPGVSLVLEKVLPHARPNTVVTARQTPLPEGMQGRPAIEVELKGPGIEQREWLVQSQPQTFGSGGQALTLTLATAELELPFAIRLDDFELESYPGTNRPAMYRSRVTVLAADEQRTVTIEMNRPLVHDGWTFFQSGYNQVGGREVSILAVSKDPGKPIVYVGSTLMVIGVVITAAQRLNTLGGAAPRPGGARPAPQAARKEDEAVVLGN